MTQIISIQHWEKKLHKAHLTTIESLSLYRIIFSAYFLIFGFSQFIWIKNNPDLFFRPPILSLAIFFNGFPSETFFQMLDCFIGIFFILLLFGFFTRSTSIILSLLLIIGNSFNFSFGKINHGSHIAIFTLLLFAFLPWGQKYSIDSYNYPNHTVDNKYISCGAFSLLALFIGFGYFTAGFPKLLGWVDFDLSTHGARAWLYNSYYAHDRTKYLAEFFINMKSSVVWEIMDYTAVIFEISFLFAVFHRIFFKIFLYIAVYFHFINLLMLNISFHGHYIIYAAFLPWNRFSFRDYLDRITLSCRMTTGIMIFLLMAYLMLFISDMPFRGLLSFFKLGRFIPNFSLVLSSFAAFVVLICVFCDLRSYYRNRFLNLQSHLRLN